MKKTRKLLAALVLAAVLLPILASCSSLSSKKFLKYKDQSATEAVFQYLCCIEKTQYLYEAYGTDSSTTQASSLQDNPSLWTMLDSSGVSVGDTLKNSVLNKLKITMYLAQYAQDSGYVLNDTAKKSLKGQLDSFAAKFESKAAFNEKLAEYGIDYDLLYDYYLLQGLSYRGEDLLFGEGAKDKV